MTGPKKENDGFEPVRPAEDMDRMPWLRHLPDLSRLLRGAQVAAFVFLLLAAAVTSLLDRCSPRAAHGSPLDCEGIKDADRRHFCRAVSIPRKSECEFIRNKELRCECRARTKR